MAPTRGGSKRACVGSGGGGDRISDLPDEVIHRVLWFLPTHEAVKTSLLSRRWRELWKSTRRLSIAGLSRSPHLLSTTGSGGSSPATVDKLSKFVNHLLLSRKQGPLDECRFSFDGFKDMDGAQVDMWIRYVLDNVWQLRVLLINLGTSIHVKLAGTPLVSENLVSVGKIFSQSLSVLVLNDCDGQTPLLESMPSLERAYVRLGWFAVDHCTEGICGECHRPCENSCDNDNNSSENNSSDNGNSSDNNSSDNGNCSDQDNYDALCGLCANCRDNDNISGTCLLLRGLSRCTYLELSPSYQMLTFERDLRWCPTFSNLRTLVLSDYNLDGGFHALLCFLQQTPVLQKLTLKLRKIHGPTVDISSYLKRPVVLRHLRIVEVKCPVSVQEEIFKLWKILITWGRYIVQFNIESTHYRLDWTIKMPKLSGRLAKQHRSMAKEARSTTPVFMCCYAHIDCSGQASGVQRLRLSVRGETSDKNVLVE
uniref:F-box domain-containing protein n=1 Tax=Oryza nivara TaxID=4536 RepID=A0A0E0IZC6_ORYNI